MGDRYYSHRGIASAPDCGVGTESNESRGAGTVTSPGTTITTGTTTATRTASSHARGRRDPSPNARSEVTGVDGDTGTSWKFRVSSQSYGDGAKAMLKGGASKNNSQYAPSSARNGEDTSATSCGGRDVRAQRDVRMSKGEGRRRALSHRLRDGHRDRQDPRHVCPSGYALPPRDRSPRRRYAVWLTWPWTARLWS